MNTQSGFSLVEMLAAIFVLSLGAVAVSESISGLFNGWQRTDVLLNENARKRTLLAQASDTQARAKSDASPLIYDFPLDHKMVLATPRVDKDASCKFDLVARQCR